MCVPEYPGHVRETSRPTVHPIHHPCISHFITPSTTSHHSSYFISSWHLAFEHSSHITTRHELIYDKRIPKDTSLQSRPTFFSLGWSNRDFIYRVHELRVLSPTPQLRDISLQHRRWISKKPQSYTPTSLQRPRAPAMPPPAE
jgi:hypothetical protein